MHFLRIGLSQAKRISPGSLRYAVIIPRFNSPLSNCACEANAGRDLFLSFLSTIHPTSRPTNCILMPVSLQDQLRKSGLIDDKKAKQLKRAKNKQEKLARKTKNPAADQHKLELD